MNMEHRPEHLDTATHDLDTYINDLDTVMHNTTLTQQNTTITCYNIRVHINSMNHGVCDVEQPSVIFVLIYFLVVVLERKKGGISVR